MLRRALESVLAQTHRHLAVTVINDDPRDSRVAEIVADLRDPRVALHMPVQNRGATANFNIAFAETTRPYVSLLEDDNWWEPTFVERMLGVLRDHPQSVLAVANAHLEGARGRKLGRHTAHRLADVRRHDVLAASRGHLRRCEDLQ
jgi:glycosyltransferase involved in cell wall biosynthesis